MAEPVVLAFEALMSQLVVPLSDEDRTEIMISLVMLNCGVINYLVDDPKAQDELIILMETMIREQISDINEFMKEN
jgi:hypothetical protein